MYELLPTGQVLRVIVEGEHTTKVGHTIDKIMEIDFAEPVVINQDTPITINFMTFDMDPESPTYGTHVIDTALNTNEPCQIKVDGTTLFDSTIPVANGVAVITLNTANASLHEIVLRGHRFEVDVNV